MTQVPNESDDQRNNVGFINDSTETNNLDFSLDATASHDSVTHDMTDIFQRYRLIHTQDLGSANLFRFPFVDFFSQPQVQGRIQGVMGINGTLKCRLTWNTDPMIQGLYILYYTPLGYDTAYDQYPNLYTSKQYKAYLTGFPHVIFNVARTSSAELSIPYIGETAYIPLYNYGGKPQVGHFCVAALSPIVSNTSPAAATLACYFSMDNVSTFGTQPDVATAQSHTMAHEAHRKQAGSNKSGKVSGFLKKVAPIASMIPTAGWMVGAAGAVSDIFGWSAPTKEESQEPVQLTSYFDLLNGDKVFMGGKLAQNSNANINKLNGLKEDELLLSSILSQYEFVDAFTMTKTTALATKLAEISLRPGDMFFSDVVTIPTGSLRFSNGNHLNYLSNMFNFYRGSLRFKIEPVATRFHSCRIRIVVTPVETTHAYENMSYTYSQVVDISDPTSFEFTVPYLSQNPWRQLNNRDYEKPMIMYVYVENQLVAPDNVADHVDFFLFVKAGDDFEVAMPGLPKNIIFSTDYKLPTPAMAQADLQMTSISNKTEEANSLAIGDPIRSLRPVMKRFNAAFNILANGQSEELYFTRKPYIPNPSQDMGDAFSDFLSMISQIYCYSRGGMRLSVMSQSAVQFALEENSHNGPYYNGVTTASSDPSQKNYYYTTNGLEAVKLEVPYYSALIRERIEGPADNGILIKTAAYSPVVINRAVADDFDFHFMKGATPRIAFTPKTSSS